MTILTSDVKQVEFRTGTPARMQCWLHVKYNRLARKHHRQAQLNGEVLSFHAQENGDPEDIFDLIGAMIDFDTRSNPRSRTLRIVTTRRIYTLTFMTCEEMQIWGQSLDFASKHQFEDHYRLADKIADGTFSRIYLCHPISEGIVIHNHHLPHQHNSTSSTTSITNDHHHHQHHNIATANEYVVKIVRKRKHDTEALEWLRRERHVNSLLNSPCIVRAVDLFSTVEKDYLVFEYMAGGTLEQLLSHRKRLPESYARNVMQQLFTSLNYIHSKNVVHRDIQPSNIFLSAKKFPMSIALGDFGLSNFLSEKRVNSDVLTSMLGVPPYISADIVRRIPYGPAADMWSAGVVLFEILSGTLPFTGRTDREVIERIKQGIFAFDHPVWASISADAKGLVRQLLQIDPYKRISALASLQHKWIIGTPNGSRPVSSASSLPPVSSGIIPIGSASGGSGGFSKQLSPPHVSHDGTIGIVQSQQQQQQQTGGANISIGAATGTGTGTGTSPGAGALNHSSSLPAYHTGNQQQIQHVQSQHHLQYYGQQQQLRHFSSSSSNPANSMQMPSSLSNISRVPSSTSSATTIDNINQTHQHHAQQHLPTPPPSLQHHHSLPHSHPHSYNNLQNPSSVSMGMLHHVSSVSSVSGTNQQQQQQPRLKMTPSVRAIQREGLVRVASDNPNRLKALLNSEVVQRQLSMALPYRRRFVVIARAFVAVFRLRAIWKGHSATRQLSRLESGTFNNTNDDDDDNDDGDINSDNNNNNNNIDRFRSRSRGSAGYRGNIHNMVRNSSSNPSRSVDEIIDRRRQDFEEQRELNRIRSMGGGGGGGGGGGVAVGSISTHGHTSVTGHVRKKSREIAAHLIGKLTAERTQNKVGNHGNKADDLLEDDDDKEDKSSNEMMLNHLHHIRNGHEQVITSSSSSSSSPSPSPPSTRKP